MSNHLRASFLSLRHSRSVQVCLVITLLCALAYAGLSHLIAIDAISQTTGSAAQGVSDIMIILFLGSLLTGVAIAQDFETKTVHDAILAAPRGTIVIAKTLVFLGVIAALTLPYTVVTLASAASGAEFAPVLPTFYNELLVGSSGTGLNGGELVRAAGLSLVAALWYAGQLSICLPFAFLLRRPVVILGIGFVGGLLMQSLASVLGQSTATEGLAKLLPWGRDVVTLQSSGGEVLGTVIVCVAWVVAMAALAWLVFRRADIK